MSFWVPLDIRSPLTLTDPPLSSWAFHLTGVSTEADEKLSLSNQLGQETVDAFTTLSTVVAHLHPHLHSQVTNLFPHIIVALQSKFSVIRQAASRAISAVCDVATVEGMKNVVESVLRFLGDPTVAKRQGAVEVVSGEFFVFPSGSEPSFYWKRSLT